MAWVGYPYYWYYPFDLYYLMPMMFQWMMIPYYYMIYLEVFRAAIDAWKKALESISKSTASISTA